MATLKTGKWTPEEVDLLKVIPKDSNSLKALTKAAKTFKRSYATTYQKWYTLLQNKKVQQYGDKVNPKDVPAMELKFDPDFVVTNSRVNEVEVISFKKSLDANLPKLEPLKGAITIPTRLEKIAKEHFKSFHPKVFQVTGIAGNNRDKRVIRKL